MQNTLIKASAGTGKTFALATRMIRLLLLGEEPSALVALTFSRAAAGEIFDKLAERLARAAASDEGAANESETVLRDIAAEQARAIRQRHATALTRACFSALLRRVIDSQHLSMIGTIDSFMFRMVQSFPLELGLQGTTEIMDDFEKSRRIHQAVSTVLHDRNSRDEARNFIESFRLANFGRVDRHYFTKAVEFVERWQNLYFEYPAEGMWTGATLPHTAGTFTVHDSRESLAEALRSRIGACWAGEAQRETNWSAFCDFIRNFNSAFPSDSPTIVANVLNAWQPGAACGSISFRNDRKQFEFAGEEARLINRAVETVFALHLQACIRTTQGIYRIISQFEEVYDRKTRRRGRLTFNDIPGVIARLDESIRRNIEYRFDSRFNHWALDEFQDTSRVQWNAVRNLVDEVIQSADDGRSLFIVGDVKQAIYGWRGGDVAIFDHEAASGHYHLAALNRSYRYCPEIAALVNRVFDGESIAQWLDGSADGAGALWRDYWEPHSSQQPPGYAEVNYAHAPEPGEQGVDGYIRRVTELLQQRRPWTKGIRTAVLVRGNEHGRRFAEAFKTGGIPTVWEGESSIGDTPAVSALLHALALAEHPGNRLAWQHVCATPLSEALFATECAAGDTSGPALLSQRVLADIARDGLERTLQNYVALLDATLDDFSRERLHDLIRASSEFSEHFDAETTLSDFIAFVEQFKQRDIAGSSTVRIQTIHRSKGLGFDYVILPVIEHRGITTLGRSETIAAPDKSWLLKTPSKLLCERHPALREARRHAVDKETFEELCVLYVAMTRAKRAMTVIVKTPPKSRSRSEESPRYFGEYLASRLDAALPWSCGAFDWESEAAAKAPKPAQPREPCAERRKRREHARATPSTAVIQGMNAATLFSRSEGDALLKGTRIHEALSRIEWLQAPFGQPEGISAAEADLASPSELRDALTRPAGLTDLWRERAFEVIVNDRWVSGTFDRVVFTGAGGSAEAVVMDFKTNRMRRDESVDAFHQRLRESYSAQMELYRQALERLTGIPPQRIGAVLLLTETRECLHLAPASCEP